MTVRAIVVYVNENPWLRVVALKRVFDAIGGAAVSQFTKLALTG